MQTAVPYLAWGDWTDTDANSHRVTSQTKPKNERGKPSPKQILYLTSPTREPQQSITLPGLRVLECSPGCRGEDLRSALNVQCPLQALLRLCAGESLNTCDVALRSRFGGWTPCMHRRMQAQHTESRYMRAGSAPRIQSEEATTRHYAFHRLSAYVVLGRRRARATCPQAVR